MVGKGNYFQYCFLLMNFDGDDLLSCLDRKHVHRYTETLRSSLPQRPWTMLALHTRAYTCVYIRRMVDHEGLQVSVPKVHFSVIFTHSLSVPQSIHLGHLRRKTTSLNKQTNKQTRNGWDVGGQVFLFLLFALFQIQGNGHAHFRNVICEAQVRRQSISIMGNESFS